MAAQGFVDEPIAKYPLYIYTNSGEFLADRPIQYGVKIGVVENGLESGPDENSMDVLWLYDREIAGFATDANATEPTYFVGDTFTVVKDISLFIVEAKSETLEVITDAQQELFTAIKLALEAKGYAVFDGALPPEKTPYPFIYLGEFQQTDREHKNAVTGSVYPVIHVWHNNWGQRGTVSRMLLDIKTVCRNLEKTTNFAWLVRNVNSRILADNTTKTPLLHGVVEADCLFS